MTSHCLLSVSHNGGGARPESSYEMMNLNIYVGNRWIHYCIYYGPVFVYMYLGHLRLALFPERPLELIVGFDLWAPLKV